MKKGGNNTERKLHRAKITQGENNIVYSIRKTKVAKIYYNFVLLKHDQLDKVTRIKISLSHFQYSIKYYRMLFFKSTIFYYRHAIIFFFKNWIFFDNITGRYGAFFIPLIISDSVLDKNMGNKIAIFESLKRMM